MRMKKDQAAGGGVVFAEKGGELTGKTVEGTVQCLSCQKYMRLGDASFCFRRSGGFGAAAEISGWIPGQCDLYLKEASLFEPAL